MNRLTGLLAALSVAFAAPAANAMTFMNAGDTATVEIFGFDKVTEDFVGSLTADLTFTLVSKGDAGKTWNFTYNADNTSSDQVARLVSFATSVDPNFKPSGGVTGASGAFTAAKTNKLEDFDVELCFYAGNNCNGGGNAGLTSPALPSMGAFTLKFQSAPTQGVTFSGFAGKFQSTQYADGGSMFAKECPVTQACGVGAVPEPGTWALMIIGFGAAGAALRRRRAVFA